MVCQDCGYVMAPFETACPRCVRLKALKQTRRLPDLRTMATQRLVQLNQCPQCKFLLFPGDTVCSACGASLGKGNTGLPGTAGKRRSARIPLVMGIVVSAVTLAVVLLLYRSISGR